MGLALEEQRRPTSRKPVKSGILHLHPARTVRKKKARAVAGATGFPEETLDRLRQEARHDRDHAHQLQLQLQTLQSQRDGLQQTIDRMQMQKERLEERLDVLRIPRKCRGTY